MNLRALINACLLAAYELRVPFMRDLVAEMRRLDAKLDDLRAKPMPLSERADRIEFVRAKMHAVLDETMRRDTGDES